MDSAIKWYERYEQLNASINIDVYLRYADALLVHGQVERSLQVLMQCNSIYPENAEVAKKIWQLQNINFLYEDSMYYQLKEFPFNTKYDEISPEIFGTKLIFASNRPGIEIIQRLEGSSNKPFFTWLLTDRYTPSDSINELNYDYADCMPFAAKIDSKFHKGAVAFTTNGDTMIFTRSGVLPGQSGNYTTQLFFAKRTTDSWIEFDSFPYNSEKYSLTHPALSDDGRTLYFSSDRPGGFGGKDLYYSRWINREWTTPANLGDKINTSQDESHPCIQNNVLYFSSNGHPGLGGLDIFKIRLDEKIKDVINMGYPVNTAFDDFDLVIDSTGIYGYLVSDRYSDNDNIFELVMQKLTFPISVRGNIRYKISELNDSVSMKYILANARLELIDKSTNAIVGKTTTDTEGKFKLEIPYESQFILNVNQKDFGHAVVSMEIPENHLDYLDHEIVIVKE